MRSLLYALLALCAAGCGGAAGIIPFSIFEGEWAGTWEGPAADGPATFEIDALGDITGVMHSDATNEDGAVTGSIENNGDVTLSVTFPGESAENGDGTLVLTNAGASLEGTLDFSGSDVVFNFDRQ